jgi:hypothetical protein
VPCFNLDITSAGDPVPDSESVMYQQKLFIPMRKGTEAGDYEIDNEHDLQVCVLVSYLETSGLVLLMHA